MSDVIRVVDREGDRVCEVVDAGRAAQTPAAPALPEAKVDIHIRPGVLSDYAFIDALQKANKKGVGFMWEKAIKGHLEKGNVLVAEATGMSNARMANAEQEQSPGRDSAFVHSGFDIAAQPVGYVLGVDRYLKRDELGVIYQMCVVREYRRSLVAANLLKAKFESSAYGCRLYCCWCAQDLEANRFWEAMGFVPLAFRTGEGAEGPRGRGAKGRPGCTSFGKSALGKGTRAIRLPGGRRIGSRA